VVLLPMVVRMLLMYQWIYNKFIVMSIKKKNYNDLLKDLKRANKSRKEELANRYGAKSVEDLMSKVVYNTKYGRGNSFPRLAKSNIETVSGVSFKRVTLK
jgi:hypothetical protein